eukprot:gene5382-555_t
MASDGPEKMIRGTEKHPVLKSSSRRRVTIEFGRRWCH